MTPAPTAAWAASGWGSDMTWQANNGGWGIDGDFDQQMVDDGTMDPRLQRIFQPRRGLSGAPVLEQSSTGAPGGSSGGAVPKTGTPPPRSSFDPSTIYRPQYRD